MKRLVRPATMAGRDPTALGSAKAAVLLAARILLVVLSLRMSSHPLGCREIERLDCALRDP